MASQWPPVTFVALLLAYVRTCTAELTTAVLNYHLTKSCPMSGQNAQIPDKF